MRLSLSNLKVRKEKNNLPKNYLKLRNLLRSRRRKNLYMLRRKERRLIKKRKKRYHLRKSLKNLNIMMIKMKIFK